MNTTNNFYQLLHNYFQVYLVTNRLSSMQTVRSYKQVFNQFRKYLFEYKNIKFSEMNFSHISRENVYAYLTYLRDERHLSVTTLNQRLAAIKAFLKYCGEEDVSLYNFYQEVNKIHKFKGGKKLVIEYLTQSQLKLLFSLPDISTVKGRRDRFLIIFLYETGARIEEFLNIKKEDIIHGDTITVRLYGKGRKVRYVPLLGTVIEHLNEYLNEFHCDTTGCDYLFFTIHGQKHTQMSSGTVDNLLKKYAKMAASSDSVFPLNLHPHMMRHSIAMAMYKKGIPLSYIKDFLGHSDISTTSIYAYADTDTIAEAISSIQDVSEEDGNRKKWKDNEEELLNFCGLL